MRVRISAGIGYGVKEWVGQMLVEMEGGNGIKGGGWEEGDAARRIEKIRDGVGETGAAGG